MIYNIKAKGDYALSSFYSQAMKELGDFYEVNWNQNSPEVVTVPNRKIINALRGYSTEDWVVGWSENNIVFLLNSRSYSKESQHKYNSNDYYKLLKHELSHCFYRNVFTYSNNPIWLNEGLALYLSGMNSEVTKPNNFKSFLKFYDNSSAEVYAESGLVVELLVTKFGKEKLISLIRKIKDTNTDKEFQKLFEKIYNFELSYSAINKLWSNSN